MPPTATASTATACPVDCQCHAGPHTPCNVPGGCGSEGCGRPARRGSCPACWRREPAGWRVCEPCQAWLPTALAGIEDRWRDLPDRLAPSDQLGEKVSGTPDPAAPLNLDVADLLTRVVRIGGMPVDGVSSVMEPATELALKRMRMATFDPAAGEYTWWLVEGYERRLVVGPDGLPVLRPVPDQVGYLPVAQVLDSWAREWVEARRMRERRPLPTVPVLVDWLGNRLDWACRDFAPVGDFCDSMRTLRGQLMAVLGEFDPPPQACDGVQCKRCDRRELFVVPDGSGDRECGYAGCRKIYREEEFLDWIKHLAGYEKSRLTPAEVREVLRPSYRRTDVDAT